MTYNDTRLQKPELQSLCLTPQGNIRVEPYAGTDVEYTSTTDGYLQVTMYRSGNAWYRKTYLIDEAFEFFTQALDEPKQFRKEATKL